MADELRHLKQGEEVYVKSLGMSGKVVRVRTGDVREAERDKHYEVQITGYFRRADLEPDDSDGRRQQRELDLQRKTERLEAARKKVVALSKAGGAVAPQVVLELLFAFDDLQQAHGYPPFLVPIKPPPGQ